jgi:uracil-DNA glycosylase
MWQDFVTRWSKCRQCKDEGLLDGCAFPIFAEKAPLSFDILFILEAPNRDDTYNPAKGYLTVDALTDPSGRLFHELFTGELRFPTSSLFVTNSVLCLPKEKSGKYPVTAKQRTYCNHALKQMVDQFCPKIVCPLGAKALAAVRQICDHHFETIGEAAATPISWYGRILFPLFHTSSQARNPRNGRPVLQQRADWRMLREVWEQAAFALSKESHSSGDKIGEYSP